MNVSITVMSKRLTVWPPVRATTLVCLTVLPMQPLAITSVHVTAGVPQVVKDRSLYLNLVFGIFERQRRN